MLIALYPSDAFNSWRRANFFSPAGERTLLPQGGSLQLPPTRMRATTRLYQRQFRFAIRYERRDGPEVFGGFINPRRIIGFLFGPRESSHWAVPDKAAREFPGPLCSGAFVSRAISRTSSSEPPWPAQPPSPLRTPPPLTSGSGRGRSSGTCRTWGTFS